MDKQALANAWHMDLVADQPPRQVWLSACSERSLTVVALRPARGRVGFSLLVCYRGGRDRATIRHQLLASTSLQHAWSRWSTEPLDEALDVQREQLRVEGILDIPGRRLAQLQPLVESLIQLTTADTPPLIPGCWRCADITELRVVFRQGQVSRFCPACQAEVPSPVPNATPAASTAWSVWPGVSPLLRGVVRHERVLVGLLPVLVAWLMWTWSDELLVMSWVRKGAKLAMLLSPFIIYAWWRWWRASVPPTRTDGPPETAAPGGVPARLVWQLRYEPIQFFPDRRGRLHCVASVSEVNLRPGPPLADRVRQAWEQYRTDRRAAEARFWTQAAEQRPAHGLGGWLVHWMAPQVPAWTPSTDPEAMAFDRVWRSRLLEETAQTATPPGDFVRRVLSAARSALGQEPMGPVDPAQQGFLDWYERTELPTRWRQVHLAARRHAAHERVLERQAKDADRWVEQARLRVEQHQRQAAEDAYREALQLNPGHADAAEELRALQASQPEPGSYS